MSRSSLIGRLCLLATLGVLGPACSGSTADESAGQNAGAVTGAAAPTGGSTCSAETKAAYGKLIERISNHQAARSISCAEAKVLEAAVMYAQKSSCASIDYAVLMANDVLDQRDENPGPEITRMCP